MYTITLADGTRLESLELNGNNYIAPTIIEDSVFSGHLSTVTITDDDTTETYTDMVLEQNQPVDGKSWFILREQTPQEKALGTLKSLIDSTENNITDVQVALAEVYELIAGGGI